jgi:exopolyphosphatase / guanosine-5'-triphosphate,3'-diphosphate pyrophosphatase
MRISAIDLGSNAVRMIVAEWTGDRFEILKKYRTPLRLGTDVFHDGKISEGTLKFAEKCFQDFAAINKKMKVIKCRAVATSATREASNKQEFLNRVKAKTQIQLEVIDGVSEANIIFEAVKHHVDLRKKQSLLIDVGGGSVEITHSDKGQIKSTQSFPLGTVRLLEQLQKRKMTEHHIRIAIGDILAPVVEFFDENLSGLALDFAVGTGGNMECMARLKTELLYEVANESLLTSELSKILEKLLLIPIENRVSQYGLREDRADVIVPAIAVVEAILRQAGVDKMLVPGVGLRDGLLYSMI